ncbi:VTC domain-containing protein, partial [Candidatus Omnitrophota bacterium]
SLSGEHEIKFVFSNSRTDVLIQWLESMCQSDPEFPVGVVSSIYYDTAHWVSLREKINSDYVKTKVRVRWYSGLNGGEEATDSYVEAKYKIGCQRKKVRVKIPYSGEWLSSIQLDERKLLEMPFFLRSKGVSLDHTLRPVFQITFKRRRYIEPLTGSRMCIDYAIAVPKVNWNILPRINPFCLNTSVFEIKGRLSNLPESMHPLINLGCREESFSKYAFCYQKIMGI